MTVVYFSEKRKLWGRWDDYCAEVRKYDMETEIYKVLNLAHDKGVKSETIQTVLERILYQYKYMDQSRVN
jgi:hypothetical protein